MFESGALFKGLPSSRLHTILIDLQPSDVVNSPLTQLNHAEANEAGIRKLVRDLNRQMGPSKIEDNTLNKVLDMYWPKFEELLKQSMEIETDKTTENANDVSERQMLEEILSAVRNKPSGRSMIQEAIARDRLRHIDNRVEINPDMLNAIDRNTYLLERRLSEGGFITPDDLTSMNAEAVAHLAMLDHLSPKLTDPKYAMICIELKKRLFGIQLRIEGM